ncbi:hypothetical protein [Algibacillus agarilyticus]|uniref:hypothetical protein n=1 Tax=Algibacillus agarilyticus TaxID=2234133 RepID=UPI000DD04EF9|nr:hypothetical protein [Algibacillus agarilyticus]
MKLNHIFKISALAASLALAGCGGDINITPTVNDTSTTDNSVGDNSNNVTNNNGSNEEAQVVCASYTSNAGTVEGIVAGNDCLYNDSFASANISITSNITFEELPSGGVHVFEEALQIGTDGDTSAGFVVPANGPTMTVKPGANLAFKSGEAIIRIARGAKIQAVGTLDKPITFTSAYAYDRFDDLGNGARYADWGGIIINGNGITDQCTDAERTGGTCNRESEGIASYYGGNNNADSSGSIKYAKIWYAGSGPRANGGGDDLNSLTLNAVGSGSTFEYIHIHQGFDDGVEIFGGAADLAYVAVTDTQDDSFDLDAAWQGNAHHLFVMHGSVTLSDGTTAHMGNGGFEADGLKAKPVDHDSDASTPEVDTRGGHVPTISNVTVITTDEKSVRDGDDSRAMKFDDYFNANFQNVLLVKANATATQCISFSSDGEKQADKIKFVGSTMACAADFNGDADFSADAPTALQATAKTAWFDAGGNVRLGSASDVLAANGFATNTSSTNLAAASTDATSNYVGAVSDTDTNSNWYKWVEAAVTAAKAD